tara:strand:+ start:71 stop:2059 length:1989 start_codon:yes stop_codon:yes gene_type:complete
MGTAYKYVERAAEDQVNWAEVSSNFANTLKAEAELREKQKDAIDASSREYAKVLREVSRGDSEGFNAFVGDAVNTLTENSLIQNTLLKSGQLDPKRYMITRQNMADGTEAAFSMFENYNAKYKEIMALKSQNLPYKEQLSLLGDYSMASIEGFGNYQNTKMVVNPSSGIISMAKMIPDPNYKGSGEAPLIPDLNNLMTVESMQNRTEGRILKFDVIGSAQGFIGSLGMDKRVVMENIGSKYTAATFKTVSDASQKVRITDMPDEELRKLAKEISTKEKPVTVADLQQISLYTEAKRNYIASQMVGDNAAASTLVDYKATAPNGKVYEIMETTPENTALRDAEDGSGSNIILVKNQNGRMVPSLTEDQKADADRVLDVTIDSGMDYEETVATAFTGKEPAQPSAASITRGEKVREQDNMIELWNEYYTATPERREAIINAILTSPQSKNQGLIDINFIKMPDPNHDKSSSMGAPMLEFIEMTFNEKNKAKNRTGANAQPVGKGPDEWSLAGVDIHGVTDSGRRMRGLTADSERGEGEYTGGAKRDTPPESIDYVLHEGLYIDAMGLKDKDWDDGGDEYWVKKLQDDLGIYGVQFSEGPTWGRGSVNITIPGVEGSKTFPTRDGIQAMYRYVADNLSLERATNAYKRRGASTGGGGGVNGGAYN